MSAPVAMKHFAQAQKEYKPPLIANENAFLGDVYSSDQTNPEHPISCGFYRLEKGMFPIGCFVFQIIWCIEGTPLVYTYTYDEMKIIVEGMLDSTCPGLQYLISA